MRPLQVTQYILYKFLLLCQIYIQSLLHLDLLFKLVDLRDELLQLLT